MTIHVNIGEAKTRLSELVAAAVRGEEVVLDKAGAPQVRLVAIASAVSADVSRLTKRREKALGMYRHLIDARQIPLVRDMKMTDAEWEERDRRKFGPAD
jgi:prevent-host-death family protein